MRLLVFLCALFAGTAHATCFPKNNLWIPPTATTQGISHRSFNTAIAKVLKHYAPIVKGLGYELVFNDLWDDGTVNSDTDVEGDQWVINSYGGLARYPGMNTIAAYAAVACHELGHHMGGAPLYTGDWASTEGEADYWATKECLKAIGYGDKSATAASLSLAKVLADLGGEPVPSISTPDATVKRVTEEDHPMAQCRLDTYLGGIACPQRGVMSGTDPKVNSCYDYPTKTSYLVGSRPRCWFAP